METTTTNTTTTPAYSERIQSAVREETIASMLRAVPEVAFTAASLAILLGKTISGAWHLTRIGKAANDQGLVATLRFEGHTREVLISYGGEILEKFNPKEVVKQASGKLAANLNKA